MKKSKVTNPLEIEIPACGLLFANILLCYCRDINQYSYKEMAAKLGISVKEYEDIEQGKKLIEDEQAEKFGEALNIKASFISSSSLQLQMLLSKEEIIKYLLGQLVAYGWKFEGCIHI